jgi:hypothetical protein
MTPIAKDRLEEICLLYLNHRPRVRDIAYVRLGRPDIGFANWSVEQVEPTMDLEDLKASFAAVRELQTVFRMVV